MSSKSNRLTPITQEELGVTRTANGQFEIFVEPSSTLGLSKFRVVLDATTKQWRVAPSDNGSLPNGIVAGSKRLKESPPALTPTWVDNLPNTDHIRLFRATRWSETSLGPLERWPVSLQTLVHFLMLENVAASIYWGPDLYCICNAETVKMTRVRLSRDEDCMAKRFRDIWPDVWAEFGSMLQDVVTHGVPLDTLDVNLFPVRDGVIEETFWNGSFLPIRDPDGKIQGIFNRGRETTKEIISARRVKTLNAIALPPSLTGKSVWEHLFNAFRDNEREFPMAFIYRAAEQPNTRISLQLQESVGISKAGHPLVPQTTDLFGGQSIFCPYFRRAKSLDRPLLLHKANGTLHDELIQGFEWKGFGEPSTSIAIMAINSGERFLGIMVMGLNPRRPYDIDYEGFLDSLARHTSATISHAIDKEEARARADRLGRQLEDSEKQIREIAVHGPAGMVQVALNGKIQWANDHFYQLTGHSPKDEDQYEFSFVDIVDSRDQEECSQRWKVLMEDRKNAIIALRLKRKWKPPPGPEGRENEEEPIWVSVAAYPVHESGGLKYIAAAVTDISQLKWAEEMEIRNATAAKEAKRLQENFIDIVSHEMRNPLSAITQLADGISSSLDNYEATTDLVNAKSVLEYNVESAKTILLCAAHQKRIIDDVLTLSKLDSMMLSITPIVVQPRRVVKSALKMFEGEFQSHDITFESSVDKSYADLDVDWVCLDPSRLTQIFINLITNAIKFTKMEDKRVIRVRTSATRERPPIVTGVKWFPTNKKRRDLTLGTEWGTGQEIYLCFEVEDTGRGLEQEEMQKLFGRFQQATAKTHIKYGGSGLGLFISRELTETQGGEIGVASAPGKGSIFAFYIKGKQADPPDDPSQDFNPSSANPKISLKKSSSMQESEHDDTEVGEETTSAPSKTKPVILLVEDNVVNAKVLSKQLERAGCEVYTANHGVEAIDFLSKTRAWHESTREPQGVDLDCILMDVEMPIMDGLTCTRRIRQLQSEGRLQKHINVIAITANARQEQVNTVLHAGADDIMSKPFRVKELIEKLDAVMKKSKEETTVSGLTA